MFCKVTLVQTVEVIVEAENMDQAYDWALGRSPYTVATDHYDVANVDYSEYVEECQRSKDAIDIR